MSYAKIFLSLCLICSLALAGCGRNQPAPVGDDNRDFQSILAAQSELKKFSGPEELKEYFENRPQGSGSSVKFQTDAGMARESAVPSAAPAGDMGGGMGLGNAFSGTNVQVEGVDEADIIKTDGTYIYAVTDKNLMIIKAEPANELETVSTTVLPDRPQEMYVSGDRLIVFGYEEMSNGRMATMILPRSSSTFLAVYDLADRSKPQLLRRLSFEGSYVSSRLIGKNFYFITANYQYHILDDAPLPRVIENGEVISGETTNDRYAFPEVFYIDTPSSLDATTVSFLNLDELQAPLRSQVYMMPAGQTVYASTSALYLAYTKYLSEYQLRMTAARDILSSRLNDRERNLIQSISQVDSAVLSEDEKLNKINQVIEGYMARLSADEQKQVSEEVEAEFNNRYPNIGRDLERTVVHKIAFAGNGLSYAGSGEVTGRLLNQYSLDEYQGNLRLATTRSRSWVMPLLFSYRVDIMPPASREAFNNVYVLDGNMKTIGALEDLAPEEQIYSARFVNQRGYLVTFKQTDPLFVIDLSKPDQPTVVGEVKLPGFSNYLHPYDATTLIGIGREALDKGEQGVELLGLKISLFDVANQPKEISSLVLGGRGSDSVALYDYKAVLFDRERNLLAIPASLTKKDSTDYQSEFQGIIVFSVSPTGITERGRIAFRLPQNMTDKNIYLDDTARRSLFVNDALYSFSFATLKSNNLGTLAPLKILDLPRPVQSESPVKPYLPTPEMLR